MSNPFISTPAGLVAHLPPAGVSMGTALASRFYEGPADIRGDIHLHQRYFIYQTQAGQVAGKTLNVMFTIERRAKYVWPYFKDFNLWQNSLHHYYSGVLGDLEGGTFRLTVGSDPNDPGRPSAEYKVMRVIPEHVIILSQLAPQAPGVPSISPDCHVFMLNEHDGKTVVTGLMEHAALSKDMTEDQALARWRAMAPDSQYKWRDVFIPALKKLVYGDYVNE